LINQSLLTSISILVYPYLISDAIFNPKCHGNWASLSIFWASLSVDGTARASITGTSRLNLNEQTLSLLLSFVSRNRCSLCTIDVLVVLVGVYLASINFNQFNSTPTNFVNS
jgi:hypothetical protein